MKKQDAGRSAISMRADQYAWLEQLLATAARGGDVRVLMSNKNAAVVQRIVARAGARSAATLDQRVKPMTDPVTRRVMVDLQQHGPSSAREVYARVDATKSAIGSALWWHAREGRARYDRETKRWSAVPLSQLSERKVAAR